MQITETKNQGLKREFKIAVPFAEIENSIADRLKEISLTARLPGFRPGKVPVSLLKKKYGPSIMGEVLEKKIDETASKVMSERNLRASMRPDIKVTSFEDGSDLEYTMAIEVMPEIELIDLAKIKLQRLTADVDEKYVDDILGRIASEQKSSTPVSSNRKSKSGDILVIDFVGSVDGKEFQGGKGEDYSLELGSNTFIPGFEDQLIGAKAGDDVEVRVSFPDNYGADELAGKDSLFKVHVKELREPAPAELDDDLARRFGMESIDELRKSITDERQRGIREESRRKLKHSLLDILAEKHDFEIPEGMCKREADNIWKQFDESRKANPESIPPEDADKTDDEFKKEFEELSKRRVKLGLILSDIGRINGIEISSDDVNKILVEESKRYPGQEKEVMDYYRNSQEAMDTLTGPVYENKVIDFIVEMADVTDKKVSVEELFKEPDEKPAKAASKAKPKRKTAAKKTEKATKKAKKG